MDLEKRLREMIEQIDYESLEGQAEAMEILKKLQELINSEKK